MAAADVCEPQFIGDLKNFHSIHKSDPDPSVPSLIKPPKTSDIDALAPFPEKLSSDLCWTSASYPTGSLEYVVHLSDEDVRHIRDAVSHFKSKQV